MIDMFQNKVLQRDDILARVARGLQLDNTRRERMESAYKALCTIIKDDEGFFKGLDIDIYAQGSVPIGTTVRPWLSDEYDLDIVLHIKKPYFNFKPEEIYNALLKKLESDGRYSQMVEKKRRCVRLKYAGDFHMDLLPGCIIVIGDDENLKVPDRELRDWTDSNPKGYAGWFLNIANSVQSGMLENYYRDIYNLKAKIEDLPEDNFYKKKPLQTAVQLIKRYRDIYFAKKPDYATSSIILTTIAARLYNGNNSIYSAIENILSAVQNESRQLRLQRSRLKILNPVNEKEDFTEKWDEEPLLYDHFLAFINDFYEKWQQLKSDFSEAAVIYEKLFGNISYKNAVKEQVELLGKYSADAVAGAASLIISGNARTDSRGIINPQYGTKNEQHRDFGDDEN